MVTKMSLLTQEALFLPHRVWKVKFVGKKTGHRTVSVCISNGVRGTFIPIHHEHVWALEVNDQQTFDKRAPGTRWMGVWLDATASLDAMEKRKISFPGGNQTPVSVF
jgi:hypothetical protein